MLPSLNRTPQIEQDVLNYLQALKKQHFEGDIATNYADRLSLATDNSVLPTASSSDSFSENCC